MHDAKMFDNPCNCPQKGDTALTWAAHHGNTKLVKALLRHHADANAVNNDGESTLILAAKEGHFPVVTALLQHRAAINARDKVQLYWFIRVIQ